MAGLSEQSTNMVERIQVTGTLFVLSNSTVSVLIEIQCWFHLPVSNECLQVMIGEYIDDFFLKLQGIGKMLWMLNNNRTHNWC